VLTFIGNVLRIVYSADFKDRIIKFFGFHSLLFTQEIRLACLEGKVILHRTIKTMC
jgi:hypothetical protein